MDTLRIIIAEDDPDDYQTVSDAFAQLSETQELLHMNDGCELVEYLENCLDLQETLPQLILLDVNMPRMNGVQALSVIRKNAAFDNIPIVVYTTASDRELVQKCYMLGANGFVAKGFTFSNIVSFVREVQAYAGDVIKMPGLNFYDSSDSVRRKYQ